MTFFADSHRHLVCEPYTLPNLHAMAVALGIKRCWFHGGRWPHYDIPKRRADEIRARVTTVSPRRILEIIGNGLNPLGLRA